MSLLRLSMSKQPVGFGRNGLVFAAGAIALVAPLTYLLTTTIPSRSVQAQQAAPPSLALAAFPRLALTEVGGAALTNETLAGKPALVWFTASWCGPCQIGARRVAEVDREMGDGAFNVLVVFVDPNETDTDLINWRRRFGNPDWLVAFDDFERPEESLSNQLQVRYLDTKYLIDALGRTRDVNSTLSTRIT